MCGENLRRPGQIEVFSGSSPRVRGKPRSLSLPCGRRGLIPACAGKTAFWATSAPCVWAHPRVCGENLDKALLGSAGEWLIPACAGKTPPTSSPSPKPSAHPRVCGENEDPPKCSCYKYGSSPRVRGKLPGRAFGQRDTRLIPACAGKTVRHALKLMQDPAHPRVCGENLVGGGSLGFSAGSSPRVRGKPSSVQAPLSRTRLIPACAGKTVIP